VVVTAAVVAMTSVVVAVMVVTKMVATKMVAANCGGDGGSGGDDVGGGGNYGCEVMVVDCKDLDEGVDLCRHREQPHFVQEAREQITEGRRI
jgi:hypothetical protein